MPRTNDKRKIIKIADQLREFGEKYGLTLGGFDHIGSMYCPAPSATFHSVENPNLTVNLPFWMISKMGGVINGNCSNK